jgi:hypothetical protein
MENQLHILKDALDEKARLIIQDLSIRYADKIRVVLVQDGVKAEPAWKSPTYILRDESMPNTTRLENCEEISYSRLVDLIFEAESVVSW